MVLFRNDHEPAMNCIADNEEQVAEYITQNWDVLWNEIKEIDNVTIFVKNADFSDINSLFEDEHYEILGNASND